MRISARERLESFFDPASTTEYFANLTANDPLKFRDTKRYRDRITESTKKSGEKDALIVMSGNVNEIEMIACAFEFKFLGGSMVSAVGDKFVRAVNLSIEQKAPLISFSSIGGARMQEAYLSWMQLA